MAHTACIVCPVSTISGHQKNPIGRASPSSRHTKQKLSNLLFLVIYAQSSPHHSRFVRLAQMANAWKANAFGEGHIYRQLILS